MKIRKSRQKVQEPCDQAKQESSEKQELSEKQESSEKQNSSEKKNSSDKQESSEKLGKKRWKDFQGTFASKIHSSGWNVFIPQQVNFTKRIQRSAGSNGLEAERIARCF